MKLPVQIKASLAQTFMRSWSRRGELLSPSSDSPTLFTRGILTLVVYLPSRHHSPSTTVFLLNAFSVLSTSGSTSPFPLRPLPFLG